jgi:alkanesulfonate monooxygenase SsuD/methylene tetrahydromethanopterin reductase-like flavin-dependent oxidoreductase (luciferase family)
MLADGFITQSGRLEDISRDAALIAEGAARVGRNLENFEFGVMLPIFPWDGPDGWSEVRDGVRYVYAKYRQMADRVFTPPPADTPERGVSKSRSQELITGDPESLVEFVSAAIAAAKAELPNSKIHVIARSWWPGLSPAALERSSKVFIEQIAPAALIT